MLFLLAMVLTGTGVSWGQTSLGKMEFSSYPTNGSNGSFWLFGNDNFTAGCTGLTDEIYTKSGKFLIKLGGNATDCFELNFSEGVVKVGDIIRVECGCFYNEGTPELGFIVNGHSKTGTPSTNDEILSLDYTIQAGDIVDGTDGKKKIQIKRNAYSTGYHSIELLAVQRYSVTLSTKDATTGCDAWFTLGNDETQHRGTVNDIAAGTKVVFHGSDAGADHSLMNGWRKAGTNESEGWLNWGATYTVNSLDANLNYAAEFWSAYRIFANAENGATATVYTNTSTKENISGRKHHDNITETLYFSTTVPEGYTFDGWYNGSQKISPENPYGYGTYTSQNGTTDLTLTAKFTPNTQPLTVTANWQPIIPANAAGWGLTTVTVKANGADVDASKYTLEYEVVSGPLTLDGTSRNATVTSAYNKDTNKTAKVRATATPNDGAYTAGSVEFDVTIQPVAKPNVTVSNKAIRVGEEVTLGLTRDYGFSEPQYTWTLSDNAKSSLYGYTDPISEGQTGNDFPTHTFTAKSPTSAPISVNLKFSSKDSYYTGSAERGYEQAYNSFTVKPVAVPTISQEADGVHFTYEEDYGDVDAYLQYYVGVVDDAHRREWVGMGEDGHGQAIINGLPNGTRIYAQSVVRFKYPSDASDWTYVNSDMISFVTGEASVLPAISLMMQPRWKNGIAKRYIPIGVINELNGGTLTPLESQWPEDVVKGNGAITNYTMGYLLGDDNEYPIDREDKGVCISRNGNAQWAWSGEHDGEGKYLPKTAAFYMDVAGTMDIVLFAENTYNGSQNSGNMSDRRYIKVWYLNDQCTNGKPVEIKSWGILGKRYEGNNANGGNGAELRLHIRLPQLGTDGKTTLFFTYEGDDQGHDVKDEAHDLWIRGFMIQRPDLTQSIGRTDAKYNDDNKLTNLCVATENTPYVWSFKPKTTGHSNTENHKVGHDAVGFRPATTTTSKKSNEFDGRTYICGDQCDHLLVFCDNEDEPGKVAADARPEFDGRTGDDRDENPHLELVRPTVMAGNNGNDDKFNPIKSNGLKVNVTGSGWFKVKAAAPNCDVKMKVLASTNGGNSTIRVLKEFFVPKTSEMGWNEYTAYLKAQVNDYGTYDALDATGDPEKKYMSLYVVFEAADGVVLDGDGKVNGTSDYPQLNIHQMSWLNEEPVIYNFQREENPALLTTLQKSSKDANPDFYWQMGTSLKENGADTYNVNAQTPSEKTGQESTYDKASTNNGNGGKGAGYVWNIAAPAYTNAHTEAAAAAAEYKYDGTTEFAYNAKNNEFNIPISGSFLRICSMKNNYIAAHFVQNRVGSSPEIYVVDETGQPVPYCPGADTFNETNLGKFTLEARMRGCVSSVVGLTQSGNGYSITNADEAFRIDIIAPAGKEFFIFAKDAALSLARLESIAWRVNNTPVPGINGTLELSDAADNSSAIQAAMNGTGRYATSVTLKRDFTAGNWASLVLPFSMNEEKFKEVFGKNAICLHFTDVDKTTNTVTLTHHFYNMIVAGRPVLVRPSSDGSIVNGNKTISDVTLQTATVNAVANTNGFTFTGSYDNATMRANSLFISGNAVKHTANGKATKALRAWFECLGLTDIQNPSQQGARAARFVNYDGTLMDEDMATGIETALAESGMDAAVISASTVIYNLQGNKVATGAELNNLPAGVYVVKGKKFIVK